MFTAMKKIITSMMLFAAAAMAFVSCQKDAVVPENEQTTLTFASANPTTKTEWNGETIVWSARDKIRMALMIGNSWYSDANKKVKYYVSNEADLSDDSMTATFKISSTFNTDLVGDYQFYALYPSDCTGSSTDFTNVPNAAYAIASEQTSSSQTFDKSSDILWGRAVNTYTSLPKGEQISLMWTRLVAHAYITLKGLPVGETVNNITLTAQDGAALVGKYNVDITTGVVSVNTPANSVFVKCEEVTVDQNGNASFWVCINPCDVTSLNLVVDTDKAVYTIDKTNLNLNFLVNKRNVQPINMTEAERVEKGTSSTYYVKVTEEPSDWSGQYLIVCEEANVIMTGSGSDASSIKKGASVEISERGIMQTSDIDAKSVQIIKNGTTGYYIQCASGYYIYSPKTPGFSASKTVSTYSKYTYGLTLSEGAFTITCTVIADNTENYLRYNKSSGIFNHYNTSTSQTAVQLYKLED